MRAGTLRHPIIVEMSVEAQTDTGEITTTWQPYQTLMAAIETTGGREFEAVKQTHSELTHIIKTVISPVAVCASTDVSTIMGWRSVPARIKLNAEG